jgi:dipeptide transport system ATP-binding protein
MYLGKPVEHASREELFANPRHPYTQALLSATPVPDPARQKQRIVLKGEMPSPINPPSGCTFHPRCPIAVARCKTDVPETRAVGAAKVACHLAQ